MWREVQWPEVRVPRIRDCWCGIAAQCVISPRSRRHCAGEQEKKKTPQELKEEIDTSAELCLPGMRSAVGRLEMGFCTRPFPCGRGQGTHETLPSQSSYKLLTIAVGATTVVHAFNSIHSTGRGQPSLHSEFRTTTAT